MKKRVLSFLVLFTFTMFFAIACSDDDNKDEKKDSDQTTGTDQDTPAGDETEDASKSDSETVDETIEEIVDEDAAPAIGECTIMNPDFHATPERKPFFFNLKEGTFTNEYYDEYDMTMTHGGPLGILFTFRDGIELIDLGNEQSFTEVAEAPESGYASDTEVIWTDSDHDSGGEITKNVYALIIDNKYYAKLMVENHDTGVTTIHFYYQMDESKNLLCEFDD